MLDCFDYAHPNNCSHFENSKMPKCGGQSLKGGSRGEQIGSSVVFPVYKQGKIVAPGMGQLQCINHSTRVLKSPPIHIHYSMSMSATKTQNCTSNGIILKHCSIETTKIYVLMLALMNLAHVSQDRFLDPTRKMQLSACAP
jgi:hypothetical protein